MPSRPTTPGPGRGRAFTLVELVIVVMVLAILATLVIPQFTSAAGEARETTLREDLRFLRSQITLYRAHHDGVAPGFPGGNPSAAPTYDAFVAQLTTFTDAAGNAAGAPGGAFRFGRYLKRIPDNPVTGNDHVRFIAAGAPFPERAFGPGGLGVSAVQWPDRGQCRGRG